MNLQSEGGGNTVTSIERGGGGGGAWSVRRGDWQSGSRLVGPYRNEAKGLMAKRVKTRTWGQSPSRDLHRARRGSTRKKTKSRPTYCLPSARATVAGGEVEHWRQKAGEKRKKRGDFMGRAVYRIGLLHEGKTDQFLDRQQCKHKG